jgi:hypothetical protein
VTARRSADQVRRARMRAQLLSGRRPVSVAEVVRALGGVQAQDTPASRLAIRPRSTGVDADAVRRACNQDRSVVRTWAMRGTLHMVAAEDAGWLVGLLGRRFLAAGRRRRLQLGLDDRLCGRALEALPAVLADGPLSRAELVRALAAKGVKVNPDGQAPAHLVGYAALSGLICRGPDLDGDEASYVLLEDWAGRGGPGGSRRGGPPVNRGRTLEGDDALAELARRYLAGHGPAAPEDLAAWSGLAIGRAKEAFDLVAGCWPPRAPGPPGPRPGPRARWSGCWAASTTTCWAGGTASWSSTPGSPPGSRPGAAGSTRPWSSTAGWPAPGGHGGPATASRSPSSRSGGCRPGRARGWRPRPPTSAGSSAPRRS